MQSEFIRISMIFLLITMYKIFQKYGKVSTDSRRVEPNSIFFALRGENFNGNLYARAALESGAAYAIVDDPSIMGDRIINVPDTLKALQELAQEHRMRLGIPIIALTGSNGKTTTKELMLRVLSTKYQCRATIGNLNNHIGVPLTLLSFDNQTEIGIVEMGANHLHEIELLCTIARPNVGLITNVGLAHLEGFGSSQGVRQAKGELFDYLERHNGEAIYNLADETLVDMVAQRRCMKSVGYDPCKHVVELSIYGEYNQLNAQAALAVGLHFGVSAMDAKRALKNYLPVNNRSQIMHTQRNTLYMDAYNANPSSMQAAIDNFTKLKEQGRVAILGEMRELGEYAAQEHEAIVAKCDGVFEQLFLVGANFCNCAGSYKWFATAKELTEYLKVNTLSGKHILIKGSRGVALEAVTEVL